MLLKKPKTINITTNLKQLFITMKKPHFFSQFNSSLTLTSESAMITESWE